MRMARGKTRSTGPRVVGNRLQDRLDLERCQSWVLDNNAVINPATCGVAKLLPVATIDAPPRSGRERLPGRRRMGVRRRLPPVWREAHATPAGGRHTRPTAGLSGAHLCLSLRPDQAASPASGNDHTSKCWTRPPLGIGCSTGGLMQIRIVPILHKPVDARTIPVADGARSRRSP